MIKTKTKQFTLPVLGLLGATLAFTLLAGLSSVSAAPLYFNGFETDIAGWETPTRVPSGTDGIPSSTGGFHATTAAGAGDFTRWGGYNYGAGNAVPTVFKEYTTSVDIYLNVAGGWANNTRFDFSSAINNAAGTHLSDFIFNGGFYNDTDGSPGSGSSRFVISACYNSQPGSAYAKNPGFDPIAISATDWYTFKHHFYDNAGVLNVDMSIFDSNGTLIKTWTRVSAPIAGVGGNRYGWFDFNEFSTLAFDNSMLRLPPVTLTAVGFAAPMNQIVVVKKKSNHVLPFKMQILDVNGVPQTDADIAAPVIEIQFGSTTLGGTAGDDLLSSGRGDEGNQFTYNGDGTWQFNLSSKQFTAPGTYTVTAVSGDSAEYTLNVITGQFIIE